MTSVMDQPLATVAQAAAYCLRAFEGQLQHASAENPRLLSLVMDQQARFSVWASNIRVFGYGRASLDHRLREAYDVRDAIVGLLETLNHHIQSLGSTSPTPSNILQVAPTGVLNNSDEQEAKNLRQVAAQITLLHRFSNVIRTASRETKHPEAAKHFRMQDEEGNDTEASLYATFDHYIHDRFPNLDESIRSRLTGAMVLQRKRVLYRRSRYGTASIKVPAVPLQPTSRGIEIEMAVDAIAPNQPSQPAPEVAPVPSSCSVVGSVTQTATTLVTDTFRKVSTSSVVSATRTVATNKHERLVYPPAPQGIVRVKYSQIRKQHLESEPSSSEPQVSYAPVRRARDWTAAAEAVGEITCPFCFHALPVQDVIEPKRWEQHVIVDLEPYVCLFNDCDTGEELYSHSKAWLQHMSQHTMRWRCKAKSHSPYVTASRDEYLSHMKAEHPGKFTESQIEILSDTNCRTSGRLFDSCPLCGETEVDGKMEDHVIGHLRLLGLKALPSYEDDGPESASDSEGVSENPSGSKTRSTLLDEWDPPSGSHSRSDEDAHDISRLSSAEAFDLLLKRVPIADHVKHPLKNLSDTDMESETDHIADTTVRSGSEGRDWEWGLVLDSTEAFTPQEDDPIIRNIHARGQKTGQGDVEQESTSPELGPDEPKPRPLATRESSGATLGGKPNLAPEADALLLDAALEDLRRRVDDKKTYTIESLGKLLMHGVFSLLPLRKSKVYKEYFVYLFEGALLCCRQFDRNSRGSLRKMIKTTRLFSTTDDPAVRLERKGLILMASIADLVSLAKSESFALQVWWRSEEGEEPRMECVTFKFADQETLNRWHAGLKTQWQLKTGSDRGQTDGAADVLVYRAIDPDASSSRHTAPVSRSPGFENATSPRGTSVPAMMASGSHGKSSNRPPRIPDTWLRPPSPPWSGIAKAKVCLDETAINYAIDITPWMGYEGLMDEICDHEHFTAQLNFHRGSIRVQYKDDEGDWVNIEADDDVAMVVSESPLDSSGNSKIELRVTQMVEGQAVRGSK